MTRPHILQRSWRRSARLLRAHPRLLAACAAGVATMAALPVHWAPSVVTRTLVAWNAGVVLYLVLALWMMARSNPVHIRRRASLEDEGRWVVLILVSLAALASLVAIALQLGVARQLPGILRLRHVGLAAFTVLTSWAFMQLIFALHYAHEYYAPRGHHSAGGLDFPGAEAPDYFDFAYTACIIGTSAQTADVSFTSRTMRRTGLLHCVLAYFFNTTVLALAINIAAGLL